MRAYTKKVAVGNQEMKENLEELEQYILATSETINEKVEEI